MLLLTIEDSRLDSLNFREIVIQIFATLVGVAATVILRERWCDKFNERKLYIG